MIPCGGLVQVISPNPCFFSCLRFLEQPLCIFDNEFYKDLNLIIPFDFTNEIHGYKERNF